MSTLVTAGATPGLGGPAENARSAGATCCTRPSWAARGPGAAERGSQAALARASRPRIARCDRMAARQQTRSGGAAASSKRFSEPNVFFTHTICCGACGPLGIKGTLTRAAHRPTGAAAAACARSTAGARRHGGCGVGVAVLLHVPALLHVRMGWGGGRGGAVRPSLPRVRAPAHRGQLGRASRAACAPLPPPLQGPTSAGDLGEAMQLVVLAHPRLLPAPQGAAARRPLPLRTAAALNSPAGGGGRLPSHHLAGVRAAAYG